LPPIFHCVNSISSPNRPALPGVSFLTLSRTAALP
jgi:hypothetical protein